jgi:hypothetical protein
LKRTWLYIGLTLFAAPACVDPIPLDDHPCPCVSGWKCCRTNLRCAPNDQICPGGAPCSIGCEEGQICFAGICYVCDRNRYCGIDCTDCTSLYSNTACVEGRCGCRSEADCSPTKVCQNSSCQTPGEPDGGVDDGGSDGAASDGGGGDTGPYCNRPWTNKRCGYSCTDCTAQESDWACNNDRCGCYHDADCAAGQTCTGSSCTPSDDSGRDGGV